MSDRVERNPVIGVILLIAITVILAAVIGTVVLGTGGYDGSAEAQEPTDPLEEANIDRVVDDEAGVVCYKIDWRTIDCLPLNQTRLTPGGSP